MKIAVGMSGGVDSSVAVLLLLREGHEVTGVAMSLRGDQTKDLADARAACAALGVQLRVFDCACEYGELVLEDYRREYLAGRTPNPCVRCNPGIKFGLLPDKARAAGLDFERFATGHYARVERDASSGRFLLRKAVDSRKDQSYFLYRLSQEQLRGVMFPVGGLRKEEVRALARSARLPVYAKAESQDFACVGRRDLIGRPDVEGPILDTAGRPLGRHRGVWNYTRGQRRGLGVASGTPLYVVDIRASDNTVVLGSREEACSLGLTASELAWVARPGLESPVRLSVRIRSTRPERPALVSPAGTGRIRVDFDEPELGVAPGQSAVLYDGDMVVGGGVIVASEA